MAPRTRAASIDAYLAAQPEAVRPVLERVRATIRRTLPRAVEGISYGIPIFKVDGRMVLYFAGFRRHWSIYPATARVLDELGDALAGALHSKATLRFPYEDGVPARLVARIAKVRAAEVGEEQAARAEKKAAARKPKPAPRRKPAKARSR
jgi:uncharacterized protein YdhG (YjbR/CyaY superfamily)